MRTLPAMLLLTAVLAVAGCGGDSDGDSAAASREATAGGESGAAGSGYSDSVKTDAAATDSKSKRKPKSKRRPTGTKIVLAGSRFGRMLFDSRKQAIYIFERDRRSRSNCYGECAEEWPPVFTRGTPRAGKGVRRSLLGTTKRRDGKRQVTYAGKPLYFYAHEGRRQVLCHNVDLNGGFWWVVGANGKRRP